MPGPVLTTTASVMCAHLGKGSPVNSDPRVSVLGQPVVTLFTQYGIASCQLPTTSSGMSPPCVNGSFTSASTRVMTSTGFVLLADSQGSSTPNLTPLVVVPNQARVVGG